VQCNTTDDALHKFDVQGKTVFIPGRFNSCCRFCSYRFCFVCLLLSAFATKHSTSFAPYLSFVFTFLRSLPGGAGGVGHFAVQLALFKGATVISSASRADGRELLKKLGVADAHILDYKQVDVVAEVRVIQRNLTLFVFVFVVVLASPTRISSITSRSMSSQRCV
jgi:hypothetical protein